MELQYSMIFLFLVWGVLFLHVCIAVFYFMHLVLSLLNPKKLKTAKDHKVLHTYSAFNRIFHYYIKSSVKPLRIYLENSRFRRATE